MIQFGNKVSFAENKSRRTWKPNVQRKSLYSETLGEMLRFRMTTHAIRCVKKAGGIDEYLINAKDSEIKYPKAIEYKRQIIALRQSQVSSAPHTVDVSGKTQELPSIRPNEPNQGLRELVKPSN